MNERKILTTHISDFNNPVSADVASLSLATFQKEELVEILDSLSLRLGDGLEVKDTFWGDYWLYTLIDRESNQPIGSLGIQDT